MSRNRRQTCTRCEGDGVYRTQFGNLRTCASCQGTGNVVRRQHDIVQAAENRDRLGPRFYSLDDIQNSTDWCLLLNNLPQQQVSATDVVGVVSAKEGNHRGGTWRAVLIIRGTRETQRRYRLHYLYLEGWVSTRGRDAYSSCGWSAPSYRELLDTLDPPAKRALELNRIVMGLDVDHSGNLPVGIDTSYSATVTGRTVTGRTSGRTPNIQSLPRTREVVRKFRFRSSWGDRTYVAQEYNDGTRSCDCPGWTQRAVHAMDGTTTRSCKHTNALRNSNPIPEFVGMFWEHGVELTGVHRYMDLNRDDERDAMLPEDGSGINDDEPFASSGISERRARRPKSNKQPTMVPGNFLRRKRQYL
jgi:hypothetical protein